VIPSKSESSRAIVRAARCCAALCLATVLAACGGGGGGGTGGTGGNLGPPATPVRLIYASTYQSASSSTSGGGIYAFRFDPNISRLSVVSNTPFGAETAGAPIAISRGGTFLY